MARVLVADDDAGVREWITEITQAAGHSVCAVEDGLEALRLAAIEKFDVVVTDISMPNEEGLGLIRKMRTACPGLKIIVVSGQDRDTLNDACLIGAHAALLKPVSAKIVLECISELLSSGQEKPAETNRLTAS